MAGNTFENNNFNLHSKLTGIAWQSSHFVIGGISGVVATSIIQPIDSLKVQIQVVSEQVGRKLKAN